MAQATLDALASGRHPPELPGDDVCAVDLVTELMQRNGVCDASYAEATACFGEPGTVELTAPTGYSPWCAGS